MANTLLFPKGNFGLKGPYLANLIIIENRVGELILGVFMNDLQVYY